MTPRVRAAFCDFGGLNALTPFEIASTPVSAAAPDANARRTTSTVTAPTPTVVGSVTCACGQVPAAHFATPVATRTYMAATNVYVGSAKRRPDSRTPLRLASVRSTTQASESATLWDSSEGAAEVKASTPAATDTATVRT